MSPTARPQCAVSVAYSDEPKRCRRRAMPGKRECWQHDPERAAYYEKPGPIEKLVTFSVSGEWLVETTRRLYWYEKREAAAYEILGTLRCDDRGITFEEMKEILFGDATLEGDSRTGIELVGGPDWPFKNELEELAKERARADERAQEATTKNPLFDSPLEPLDDEEDEDDFVPEPVESNLLEEIDAQPEAEPATKLRHAFLERFGRPSGVEGKLLRYGASVRRQRAGARFASMGGTLAPHEIVTLADEDSKRRKLHEEILNAYGFSHLGDDGFIPYDRDDLGEAINDALVQYLEAFAPMGGLLS